RPSCFRISASSQGGRGNRRKGGGIQMGTALEIIACCLQALHRPPFQPPVLSLRCLLLLATRRHRVCPTRFDCHQTDAKLKVSEASLHQSQATARTHWNINTTALASSCLCLSHRRRRPSLYLSSSPRSSREPATCDRSPTTTPSTIKSRPPHCSLPP